MTGTPYDQTHHRIRLEWGPVGGAEVTDASTYAVVVDVLSFTTTVSVAADRGVAVLPWRLSDDGAPAEAYAAEHAAELAVPRDRVGDSGRISLSPVTVRDAPGDLRRLVLPSPNGATTALALADRAAGVVAASLRNRTAVAAWLADRLRDPDVSVALVPAGERWAVDGSLRPAAEDLYGAGAVLESLAAALTDLDLSPEARVALSAWRDATRDVGDVRRLLGDTGSGRELVRDGHGSDVVVAAELDAGDAVPLLQGTSFVPAGDGGMRAL